MAADHGTDHINGFTAYRLPDDEVELDIVDDVRLSSLVTELTSWRLRRNPQLVATCGFHELPNLLAQSSHAATDGAVGGLDDAMMFAGRTMVGIHVPSLLTAISFVLYRRLSGDATWIIRRDATNQVQSRELGLIVSSAKAMMNCITSQLRGRPLGQ